MGRRGLILPAQRQRVLRADGPAHAAAGAAGVINYDLAVPDGNGAVQAAVDTFAAAIAAAAGKNQILFIVSPPFHPGQPFLRHAVQDTAKARRAPKDPA